MKQPGRTDRQMTASSGHGKSVFFAPSDCLRAAARGVLSREYGLTSQQLRVLELLSENYELAEVAKQIDRSVRTVQTYVSELYQALGVHERQQLVAVWLSLVYQAVNTFRLAPPPQPDDHDRTARMTRKPP